jgi:dTDP-4-amino-4,6-dideoxygalactose transaminase
MTRESFLSFSPPSIGEAEIAEVVDTLRSSWITSGPKVQTFESDFANRVGAAAAHAVSSGTAAMHVALSVLGIGPGDVVVTTPMTFASTVHVIEQVGATPLLLDVDPISLNLDVDGVETAIGTNEQISALLPVHLYGQPCDMERLAVLARAHDLAIVEDAAHSLPAAWDGLTVGSSDAARGLDRLLTCFSFYATKNITTAEGGMLTGPAELIDRARVWSLHGMSRDAWDRYGPRGSWFYEVVLPGFKYNMTDIQAALGLQQLKRLSGFHERRLEIVQRYQRAFEGMEELEVPVEIPGASHAWHIYALRLNLDRLSIDRDAFIEELRSRKIGTSVHFIPVHLHPYYRDKYGYEPDDFPVAHREYQRLISLPLYPSLSDDDVQDVIDAVIATVTAHLAGAR